MRIAETGGRMADKPNVINRQDRAFDFATLEYKEICQNIRESWNYITTLLRQFLIIQILLLSLVGLGNSAVTTATTMVTYPVQSKAPGAADSTAQGDISPSEKDFLARDARMKKFARYGAIIALMIIGGGFSLGAWSQSRRLFANATNFVRRAAAIEEKFGVGPIGENRPHHQYMLSRLSDTILLHKMENVLSATYIGGLIIWIVMAVLFFVPFAVSL